MLSPWYLAENCSLELVFWKIKKWAIENTYNCLCPWSFVCCQICILLHVLFISLHTTHITAKSLYPVILQLYFWIVSNLCIFPLISPTVFFSFQNQNIIGQFVVKHIMTYILVCKFYMRIWTSLLHINLVRQNCLTKWNLNRKSPWEEIK